MQFTASGKINSDVEINLICALNKGGKNDLICEKACELGVTTVYFWQADHSIVKLDAKNTSTKLTRWRTISESAAKQCGNNQIASIEITSSLRELFQRIKDNSEPAELLICSLRESSQSLNSQMIKHRKIYLLIGPEGDFSESEIQLALMYGFKEIRICNNILRAETAAITVASIVQSYFL